MKKTILSALFTGALLGALVLSVSAQTTVVVTPSNMQGWQVQTDSTQNVSFVPGPSTPPLGFGSAQMSVRTDGDGAAQLRNTNYAGLRLSNLTVLSYSTYVSHDESVPTTGDQTPYIMLNVDRDGNGTVDDLLFFEPEYQHGYATTVPDQGDNVLNTWQSWNAFTGGWYGIDAHTYDPTFGGAGSDVQPLASYLALYPNATVRNSIEGYGGVRLVAGFGALSWSNFIGNVDAFNIGVAGTTTAYDFEPYAVVTNKDQCKGAGWQSYKRKDGSALKNQGDCIQYVNTGK